MTKPKDGGHCEVVGGTHDGLAEGAGHAIDGLATVDVRAALFCSVE
jgi:hypothetical protein